MVGISPFLKYVFGRTSTILSWDILVTAFLEKEDCATALVGHRAAIWFNLNYMRIVFLTYVLSIAVLFFIAWVVNKTISKWLNQITEKIVNRLMVKDKTIKLR